MKSPLELCSRYLVPAVRRELSLRLMKRGLTGVEVARLLGVSPSLVSRYLNSERGAQIDLERHRDAVEWIERLADSVLSGHMDRYTVVREIDRIAMQFMARRHLCGYHKKLEPDIDLTRCRICPELFGDCSTN